MLHAIIIEKDALNARLIRQCLIILGYTTFSFATTVDKAVYAATLQRPDLITADVQLKEGSGIDAVRTICATNPSPILFIVGDSRPVDGRFPGAAVLNKPFALQQFAEGVQEAVSRFGEQERLVRAEAGKI